MVSMIGCDTAGAMSERPYHPLSVKWSVTYRGENRGTYRYLWQLHVGLGGYHRPQFTWGTDRTNADAYRHIRRALHILCDTRAERYLIGR